MFRSLFQRPVFATVVIATLAFGTGLVAAILGLLREVFVRPLPYPDHERLAIVYSTYPEQGWNRASVSVSEIRDLAQRSTLLETAAVFAAFRNVNFGSEDGARLVESNFSDAAYLRLQGAQPLAGRLFTDAETREGAEALVVILHHRFWQAQLGGRADVVGSTIRLNDRPFTVVGILRPEYRDFGERWQKTDVFLPLSQAPTVYGPQVFTTRSGRELYGLAKLKPGVTLAAAQTEADRLARDLEKEFPGDHTGRGFRLMPPRQFFYEDVTPLATALGCGAVLVLLIACANLAHLFLVRAAGRRRELAVRAALGAARGDLVRHCLVEVALLTAIGGALGLGVGHALAQVFNFDGMLPVPTFTRVTLDPLVVVATLAVLAGCALLFGLWPALRASRVDLRTALHNTDRTAGDRTTARRRLLLVSLEVALATVLLVGTGLTARSLWQMSRLDPGYQTERLFTGLLDLSRTRYPDRAALRQFTQKLHAELQTIPGIEGASLWGPRVLGRATYNIITTPEGLDVTDPKNQFMVRRLHFTPDALGLLKIPLLRGRVPSNVPAADTPTAPWEIVVSQKYADRFFPHQDAVGRRVFLSNVTPHRELIIVGVATPVTHYPRASIADEASVLGDIYVSMWDVPSANLAVLVRATGDAAALTKAIRDRIARVDPTLALYQVQTMEDRLALQERPQRFAAGVFALYGSLATFLAVLGVYGVLAFSVSQRTREFGVRLAVGARPAQIVTQLLTQGARWIGLGLAAGLFAAWMLLPVVRQLLVGDVKAEDPVVFTLVAALVLLVSLAAWLVPAIRAARVNPITALRAE